MASRHQTIVCRGLFNKLCLFSFGAVCVWLLYEINMLDIDSEKISGIRRLDYFTHEWRSPPRSLSAVREENPQNAIPQMCSYVRKYAPYFPKIRTRANRYIRDLPPEMVRMSWTNTAIDVHSYIHSPDVCRGDEFILWVVLSGVNASRERQAIRDTWGGVTYLKGKKFVLTFILGESKIAGLQERVNREAGKYGDIIQADFKDSYRNMTIKTILALKWAMVFCPKAKYVVRITDDVLVNLNKLTDVLQPYNAERIYLGCPNKEYLLIYREGKFKYLSEVEWKAKNWPPFQDGFFALMSMDVIRNMFLLSCKTPMTWPDDVYIGALAVMLNLPLLGYQDHCVGIGHKPHWNISETTLAKVLEETSPVMLAHFGGNPALPKMDIPELIKQYWKKMKIGYKNHR